MVVQGKYVKCECDSRKEDNKYESKCRLSCYVCLYKAMYIFPYDVYCIYINIVGQSL